MKTRWGRAVLGAALALACLPARGDAEHDSAVTVVPAAGKSGLRVEGLRGSVSIRGGDADELSYACTLSRNRRRVMPLSISEDRGWFVVGPGRRRTGAERRVEIVVPRDFQVEVRVADTGSGIPPLTEVQLSP